MSTKVREQTAYVQDLASFVISSGDDVVQMMSPGLYTDMAAHKCLPSDISIHPEASTEYGRALHSAIRLVGKRAHEFSFEGADVGKNGIPKWRPDKTSRYVPPLPSNVPAAPAAAGVSNVST